MESLIMMHIKESRNYIEIIDDEADYDTKHRLNNTYPNSEHLEFDFLVLDYVVKVHNLDGEFEKNLRYDLSDFEDVDPGEQEYEAIVNKIGNFIDSINIDFYDVTVNILLKKSLDNPIEL